MRLLAFSDIHRDLRQAERLANRSSEVDVVVAAGDFASIHRGLDELIDMLVVIEKPTVLVPGNNETLDALRHACRGWRAAHVLHGEAVELEGVHFFGIGGGVPTTPWDWSFDLTEDEAEKLLTGCPDGAVLVSHSPPRGHLDGRDLGSEAVMGAIQRTRPPVAVCGHIHECAGQQDRIGPTRLFNLGPEGTVIDV